MTLSCCEKPYHESCYEGIKRWARTNAAYKFKRELLDLQASFPDLRKKVGREAREQLDKIAKRCPLCRKENVHLIP
jgi:hypothetical protein